MALCEWPADQGKHNGEHRTTTAHKLFTHVKESGYDGVEMTVGFFATHFFRNMSKDNVAKAAKAAAAAYGLEIFGCNVWWVYDYPEQIWADELLQLAEEVRLTKLMGGSYVTFQMWLAPKYMDTAGSYRKDSDYLAYCAKRIEDLQHICWNQGMNCYIETHVGRISEDPQAFGDILDRVTTPVETNGDLSHYIYRNMRNDTKDMEKIFSRMNHTHQRMCRPYGDLSANVENPEEDWLAMGLTWKAFQFSKKGLQNGLSSRVVCGESGPMHAVKDPLTLDAKLVPLYRMMAEWADQSAKGTHQEVHMPQDWNPWKESRR